MSDTLKWAVGTIIALIIGFVGGGTLWKGGWRVIRLLTEEDLNLREKCYSREEGQALEKEISEMRAWVLREGITPLKEVATALHELSLSVAALTAQSHYVLKGFEEVRGDMRALRERHDRGDTV